ncbi:MAG: hypothetical protein AAF202_11710, partial [Pseudomonadota bacterium]
MSPNFRHLSSLLESASSSSVHSEQIDVIIMAPGMQFPTIMGIAVRHIFYTLLICGFSLSTICWSSTAAFAAPENPAQSCAAELKSPTPPSPTAVAEFEQRLLKALKGTASNKETEWQSVNLEPCEGTETCFELTTRTDVRFTINVENTPAEVELVLSEKNKALSLPVNFNFSTPKAFDVLASFLVGHELHPYLQTPDTEGLVMKRAQEIASMAFNEALEQGKRSFLHVAPTSTGKMLNFAKALKETLKSRDKKPLSIATVDRVDLVDQLAESIKHELSDQ